MSKYTLYESFDLGESYIPTTFDDDLTSLRLLAQKYDKKGDRRWVITEGSKPVAWCSYIYALLKKVEGHEKDVMIATEDSFAKAILIDSGFTNIMDCAQAYKKVTGKDLPKDVPKISELSEKKRAEIALKILTEMKRIKDEEEKGQV